MMPPQISRVRISHGTQADLSDDFYHLERSRAQHVVAAAFALEKVKNWDQEVLLDQVAVQKVVAALQAGAKETERRCHEDDESARVPCGGQLVTILTVF